MYEERIIKNKKRRQRELRNHVATFIITSLFILFLAITLGSFFSKASESENTLFKYYKTIEIDSGETLWDLAVEYANEREHTYQDYIDEVKRMNHLENDLILSGDIIIIPYFSTEFKP
jgi:hypothetical protein